MQRSYNVNCGIFAKTRKDVDEFCHNLVFSYAMEQCIEQMIKVEKEYDEAALRDDKELMNIKKIEMQTFKSSLQLTAYMFDDTDDIST
jgi:hypothetical protein